MHLIFTNLDCLRQRTSLLSLNRLGTWGSPKKGGTMGFVLNSCWGGRNFFCSLKSFWLDWESNLHEADSQEKIKFGFLCRGNWHRSEMSKTGNMRLMWHPELRRGVRVWGYKGGRALLAGRWEDMFGKQSVLDYSNNFLRQRGTSVNSAYPGTGSPFHCKFRQLRWGTKELFLNLLDGLLLTQNNHAKVPILACPWPLRKVTERWENGPMFWGDNYVSVKVQCPLIPKMSCTR